MELHLDLLGTPLAVCRLPEGVPAPGWARGELVAVIAAPREVTVVCEESHVPDGVAAERGWRAFRVEGPLDFGLVGVLASLTDALAGAGVPVFAVSTYDTDYVLVPGASVETAAEAMRAAGHEVAV